MIRSALALIGLSLVPSALPAAGVAPPTDVALVLAVDGQAELRTGSAAPPERLVPLRRLRAGMVVATATHASLTVVFWDGQRFRLDGHGRAVVAADGLRAKAGAVRRLARVPEIVVLAPLLHDPEDGGRVAVVQVLRGEDEGDVSGLAPHGGATVLRDAVVLAWKPLGGVARYRVMIEDEESTTVWSGSVPTPRVAVAAGLLHPGALYFWTVAVDDGRAPERVSTARFTTAGKALEAARLELAAGAARGEPDLALLLGEVDRRLGLVPPGADARHNEATVQVAGSRSGGAEIPEPPR